MKRIDITFNLVLLTIVLLTFDSQAQTSLRNMGVNIQINSGTTLSIDGDYTNTTVSGQDGSLVLSGILKLEGNWTNNAIGGDLLDGTSGKVVFAGSNNQTIGGSQDTWWQNLEIDPGATLELGSTQKITVEGGITNSGTLLLNSDINGSTSLIQPSAGVEALVQRYLTQTVYHYISTPVSNQDISPEFVNTTSNPLAATVDFYKFDEPANLWRNIKDASGNLNTNFETQFVVNRGYAYANSDAIYTKTFTGDLNYSNQAVSLTRTGGTGSEGWNLVGNPFPATLAANDGADETNNFLDDNTAALDDSYEALYFYYIDDYVAS